MIEIFQNLYPHIDLQLELPIIDVFLHPIILKIGCVIGR